MKPTVNPQSSSAFTRIELAAVLAALVLLAALALPGLATSRNRSEQITCLNNLRQVGLALRVWGNDHNGRVPWRTPWCEGGLMTGSSVNNGCGSTLPSWAPFINNAWFHWMWISNELAQPRLLACPSDDRIKVANDWSVSGEGGFLNPNFRNSAVSYFIGLDVNYLPYIGLDMNVLPTLPRMIVAGDRNMSSNSFPSACSSGVSVAAGVRVEVVDIYWTDALHRDSGNLLLLDGSAFPSTTALLRQTMHIDADNGTWHFLYPR